MKKALLLIIIGLILSSAAVAQTNNQPLTTEQKMLPFAMAMSLSTLGEMHDEQNLIALKVFQKQIRYWSEELKPVVEMDKETPDYKRMDTTLTATKALRAKSSESDKWQMLVGERFGVIYAAIKKQKTENKEINADDLKFDLEMIGLLANKAPSDIPSAVNDKFKEVGKLKDEPNLTSDRNLKKISDKVIEILNLISK